LKTPRRIWSPPTPSDHAPAEAALRPTRSNASTARSDAAPTSSASSPTTAALLRLATSIVIEQNDEWLVGHRYLSNHSPEAILNDYKKDNTREEAKELTAA
jgi:hypothetical protein